MALQYIVKRGDSLSGLAGRHLGHTSQWPDLLDFHNDQVGRSGGDRGRLFRINDPNMLFVGQIMFLPIRDKKIIRTIRLKGTQALPKRTALPIDLYIEYTIRQNEKPIIHVQECSDCLIKAEMRGKISIAIDSAERYLHNLELLRSQNAIECKNKLSVVYNPAISAILAKPDMSFKAGKVMIAEPFRANPGESPHVVDISHCGTDHLAGELKPQPIIGNIYIDGRRFKYCTEIGISVDVQRSTSRTIKPEFEQRGFLSSVGDGLVKAGAGLYNTFANKDFQRDVGNGFARAGKVAVLVHAAVVVKALTLYSVSTTAPAALPVTINNTAMTLIDGYAPLPPSTLGGAGIAISSLAVEWALLPPPWKN